MYCTYNYYLDCSWGVNMYLAVAGACAEQEANAVTPVTYSLAALSFDSATTHTLTTVTDWLMSPTEYIAADESGATETIRSYPFAGSPITFPSATATISVSTQNPRAICWGDNGKYLYIAGNATPRLQQITLSTLYALSTASPSTPSTTTPSWGAQGIHFNDIGDTFFAVESGNVRVCAPVSLWDISTFTVTSTVSLSSQIDSDGNAMGSNFTGLRFDPTGTKMFICYRNSNGTAANTINHSKVAEFSLSTAWDITTRAFVQSISLHPHLGLDGSGYPDLVGGLAWDSTGTQLIVGGYSAKQIVLFS